MKRWMFAPFAIVGLMIVAMQVSAQPAQGTPSSRLGWDQPAPDAATANTYIYKYYADGASTGTVLSGVTCSGSAPVACLALFPAFTPGTHTLTLTASNAAGESAQSSPLSFVFVVIPGTPSSLRIQ